MTKHSGSVYGSMTFYPPKGAVNRKKLLNSKLHACFSIAETGATADTVC